MGQRKATKRRQVKELEAWAIEGGSLADCLEEAARFVRDQEEGAMIRIISEMDGDGGQYLLITVE